MKNIHLITTSQPSRLLCNHTLKSFCFQKEENGMFVNDGKVSGASFWSIEKAKNNGFNPQHIYITNDEVIKAGDYFWKPDCNMIFKAEYTPHKGCEKVILTTDQDLIKDGVQAIDDEFLEWFVKNPSCESVEVDKNWNYPLDKSWEYKLRIIPREEHPKQIKCYCGHTSYCDCSPLEEPRKETTLEEASEIEKIAMDKLKSKWGHLYTFGYPKRPFPTNYENDLNNVKVGLYEGAKWQQERSYSEEEVEIIIQKLMMDVHCGDLCYGDNVIDFKLSPRQWFEQFKKK